MSFEYVRVEREWWLAKRLESENVFAGVTDASQRSALLRRIIRDRGCADAKAFEKDGMNVSFREAFARTYAQEL